MLPTNGSVTDLSSDKWAFEGKYDGFRLLATSQDSVLSLQSRSGRDVTTEFPQIKALRHDVILDGEVVGLDASGEASFTEIQNRARAKRIEFWVFDVLSLNGRSLIGIPYRDRRRVLEALAAESGITVPALLPGDGKQALKLSASRGLEGVVAKSLDSPYRYGRSPTWVKHKHFHTADAVIGGWKAGEGRRGGGIGALLLGVPSEGKLRYVGKVGTGFTDLELDRLKATFAPLRTNESPFLALDRMTGVTFVEPVLVGEVQYAEVSMDGKLRHPSWRGLRSDKTPSDVKEGM